MKKIITFLFVFLCLTLTSYASDVRLVQVTDIRYSQKENSDTIKTFVQKINQRNDIDFVVFTGDNINRPNEDDLKQFIKEIKKLKCPFYIALGERDVNKHKHLGKIEYNKILRKQIFRYKKYANPNYTFEKNGLVFVVADGSKDVIPSTNGYYKESVLSWLDEQLKHNSKKNVIILQHFPIIPPLEKEMYYTYEPEKYLEILAKNPNAKAVISGHFGVNSQKEMNNVIHITTAPLPQYRIIDILDCDTSSPEIWSQLMSIK